MPRYVAFLRGVSPMNASMAELKQCFEAAGFSAVRTVLSSGNVVFDSEESDEALLECTAEAAMQKALGRSFRTIVRSSVYLSELLASDPFAIHPMPDRAKRVVSFLREPCKPRVDLPLAQDGAIVLRLVGREAFAIYVPCDKGPVFMKLIEAAFGAELTTRTWETLAKCVKA